MLGELFCEQRAEQRAPRILLPRSGDLSYYCTMLPRTAIFARWNFLMNAENTWEINTAPQTRLHFPRKMRIEKKEAGSKMGAGSENKKLFSFLLPASCFVPSSDLVQRVNAYEIYCLWPFISNPSRWVKVKRGTEDGGRRTEDGGRRTEDGGRRTEDGRRRTEDGRRRTEDGGRAGEWVNGRMGEAGSGKREAGSGKRE